MLSIQENETLTLIDRGSPMGDYVRRFWMPFLQSKDLLEADGEQVDITVTISSLTPVLGTSKEFTIQVKPNKGAVIFVNRTIPAELKGIMDLG